MPIPCEALTACAPLTGTGLHQIDYYTHPSALDARRTSVERFKKALWNLKMQGKPLVNFNRSEDC